MTGLGSIINSIGNVADDLITTKEEKLKAELEYYQIDADLAKGQLEINKVEAQHKSIFVAGWRPFIGWVCGLAFAYAFIIYPVLKFIVIVNDVAIDAELPEVSISEMMPVLLGMLGLGFARTYEKQKGVNSDAITNEPKEGFFKKIFSKKK